MGSYNREIRRRYGSKKPINKKPYIIVVAALAVAIVVLIIVGLSSIARQDEVASSEALSSLLNQQDKSLKDASSALGTSESGSTAAEESSGLSVSSAAQTSAASSSSGTSSAETSSYRYSVSPFVGQVSDWRLKLANRSNVILDYTPSVRSIPSKYCQYGATDYEIDERVYEYMEEMILDAEKDGIDLIIKSAYRTIDGQRSLYNKKVNYYKNQGYSQAKAETLAAGIVAIPGTSDHSLGLGLDFNYLEQSDENKPELVWLRNHAEKYGFVMRYPKDKQNVTGVSYEPWHYRYVGRENAKEMNSKNMCLEEYVEYLSKNS